MKSSDENPPYSMRCLLGIIELVGGRQKLADIIGISKAAIDRWFRINDIPKTYMLDLLRLGEGKYTAEELLGKYDSTDLEDMDEENRIIF